MMLWYQLQYHAEQAKFTQQFVWRHSVIADLLVIFVVGDELRIQEYTFFELVTKRCIISVCGLLAYSFVPPSFPLVFS